MRLIQQRHQFTMRSFQCRLRGLKTRQLLSHTQNHLSIGFRLGKKRAANRVGAQRGQVICRHNQPSCTLCTLNASSIKAHIPLSYTKNHIDNRLAIDPSPIIYLSALR